MEIGNEHNNDNHENENENKLLDDVREPPAKRLQPSSKTDK